GEKELISEGVLSEGSVDHLFKGYLHEGKGQSSNILASGDQLMVQSIIEMALGESRVDSAEKIGEASSVQQS
ncbi:hypothetical protein HAX54_035496, partial [Datura stramonium]|nr:hypothetical protein [Datura stramonium]